MRTQSHAFDLLGFLAAGVSALALAAPAFAQQQGDQGDEEQLEEIVIVGSYIRRASQANTATPMSVIDADDFRNIGATTIADLVQTLTINNGSQNNPDAFTQNATTGTSNFNLRGLGVSSTLVLLNGKRQVTTAVTTNDGISFVDTSSLLPTIAIQRIDILEDGAAAIYGSDAVAGVVNFITRSDFEGLELDTEYQTNTDEAQTDFRIAGIAGMQGERYGVIAAIEYLDRTPLTTAEKRLSLPTDDLSALGMPGAFFTVAPIPVDPLTGAPTATPVFVPALGTFPTIPARTPFIDPTGCAEQGGFPLRASASAPPPETGIGFCGFDFGDFFNLVAEETRLTGYIEGNYDITDWFSIGVEVGFSRNRAFRNNSPTFPVLTFPIIPPNHPNLPDFFKNLPYLVGVDTSTTPPTPIVQIGGLPLAFFGRPLGNGADPSPNRFKNDTWRAAVKGTITLPNNWYVDWHFLHAQNDFTVITRDVVADAFQAALLGLGGTQCDPILGTPGVGPCKFFNPFATNFTTAPNDPDVIASFLANQIIAAESDLTVGEAVISGDLFELPAGMVGIAAGVQYRKEKLLTDYDAISNNDGFAFLIGNPDFRGDRDIIALFGELRLPLTSWFELQAALRYEDYGGLIGSTTDPKIAGLITPAEWISLRGSWGTAFRAPSVFQQFGSSTVLEQVSDPITGGTFFVGVRTFGSDAIQPEDSKAYNLGATLQPVPELTFDIDYWHFKFTDVIIRENSQAVLNAFPQDPTRVIRAGDPLFGPVVQINTNFVNASRVTTDGIDFKLRYDLDTGLGTFVPTFTATYVDSYTIIDPQAGLVKGVGSRNFTNFGSPTPRWRFNAGLNWANGRHSANVFLRYIDSIKDDQNPGAKVGTFTTVDVQYNLDLSDLLSITNNLVLTVGSINLFDKEPPHVATNGGYESRLHDPRGRMVYVRMRIGF